MTENSGKTLYLCYFGLREPLVQTQVLPYLREIKKSGIAVSILTFEPNPKENWTGEQIAEMRRNLKSEGIEWDFLTYHKTPSAPATLFDVLCGAFYAWRKVRKEKIDVLHGRVHIPTMMALIAKKFSFGKKPKVLFDIRGFFPEEYTDAGVWEKNGRLYKTVKKIERWLLREADGFVVLTERAQKILFPESKTSGFDEKKRPVEVIPCCVNLNRFEAANENSRLAMRRKLNVENRFVMVYVGSFGGWYLTEETADFYAALKEKNENAFALILTQSKPEIIQPLLEKAGFTGKDFLITKVAPAEMPLYLSAADAAVSFIKPCYSKQASSPTKNAEYLACGLPFVANDGIGDTTEFTEIDRVGVVIKEFNRESYLKSLAKIDEFLEEKEVLADRCKESAKKRFDLESVGGERYRRIYRRLLSKN